MSQNGPTLAAQVFLHRLDRVDMILAACGARNKTVGLYD